MDLDDLELRAESSIEPPTQISADNPNINLVGRWDQSVPSAPTSSWGGVYLQTRFEGPSCILRLQDGNNNWTYSIDNGPQQTLVTSSESEHVLASNLADGPHSLTLTRRTEAFFGNVTFRGFVLEPGKTLLPPAALPSRKIEFIGDSITAGFGNEGTFQDRSTQNAYEAFGPKTARTLQAQWHVLGFSGVGMHRNLDDVVQPSALAMPAYVGRTLTFDPNSNWDFSRWIPDVVVIALGTNDYIENTAGPVDRAGFRATYTSFLRDLRNAYPAAHIFCLSPFIAPPPHTLAREDIETLVTDLADVRIYHLDPVGDTPGSDNVTTAPWLDSPDGSDYIGDWTHPTVVGHGKIAAKLEQEIRAKLGW